MGRIAALDVGDATVGVAVTDELEITANPVTTIKRTRSIKADLKEVEMLLEKLEATRVIIGLPLNTEGEEGPQAIKVRDFYDRLSRRLNIPVDLWDESFTTKEADDALIDMDMSRRKRKRIIDQAAAIGILRGYLDCR